MLVTKPVLPTPAGGRELLSKLNHDALRELLGTRLHVLEVPDAPVRTVRSALAAFSGHIDGISTPMLERASDWIRSHSIQKVFVDGSNLGEAARVLKARYPHLEVCTFFHNVEARFFLGSLRHERTVRAAAILAANYLSERKAVRWSDKVICLSERDANLVHRLYGRAATHLHPMAIIDKMPAHDLPRPEAAPPRYALFVGGTFYANREGIAWYAQHVAPRIFIPTLVVGRGFDAHKARLEECGNLRVIGQVDDLAPWYLGASFVVAPIFDGSGMKTKVAEALMFGRRVVGTPEAFSGYEGIQREAGIVCRTADDFVSAIASLDVDSPPMFDEHLRSLYQERFSFAAAKARLADILGVTP